MAASRFSPPELPGLDRKIASAAAGAAKLAVRGAETGRAYCTTEGTRHAVTAITDLSDR